MKTITIPVDVFSFLTVKVTELSKEVYDLKKENDALQCAVTNLQAEVSDLHAEVSGLSHPKVEVLLCTCGHPKDHAIHSMKMREGGHFFRPAV